MLNEAPSHAISKGSTPASQPDVTHWTLILILHSEQRKYSTTCQELWKTN